jgi:hypothetical protein
MSFTLHLTQDVARHVGRTDLAFDVTTGREAVWKLVQDHPTCRDLLVNSSGHIRSTILFMIEAGSTSSESTLLDPASAVPDGATVCLVFQRVGG